MISYKQFVQEMPHWNVISKPSLPSKPFQAVKGGTHIGTINGAHVMHYHTKGRLGSDMHDYDVVDPKTNTVHMSLNTIEGHDKNEREVAGVRRFSQTSPVKAHELYKHLAMEHGHSLRSDVSLSPGSAGTWRKLAQDPDLHVTHHDANTHEEIPMARADNKFDDNMGEDSYFRVRKK